MERFDKKDILVLSSLRQNARETLTKMSRQIDIPISTIFERMRQHEKTKLIQRHTTILDFEELGFNTRAALLLKGKKETRESLKSYLQVHRNVNSIFKVNNGVDFIIEVVFKQIKDVEQFIEVLEDKFGAKAQVYFLIEDIKREAFMSNPEKLEIFSSVP